MLGRKWSKGRRNGRPSMPRAEPSFFSNEWSEGGGSVPVQGMNCAGTSAGTRRFDANDSPYKMRRTHVNVIPPLAPSAPIAPEIIHLFSVFPNPDFQGWEFRPTSVPSEIESRGRGGIPWRRALTPPGIPARCESLFRACGSFAVFYVNPVNATLRGAGEHGSSLSSRRWLRRSRLADKRSSSRTCRRFRRPGSNNGSTDRLSEVAPRRSSRLVPEPPHTGSRRPLLPQP